MNDCYLQRPESLQHGVNLSGNLNLGCARGLQGEEEIGVVSYTLLKWRFINLTPPPQPVVARIAALL